ncbi:MAG TPA: hypothetical protein V6D17_19675 [Candidatus Obscuribacterales bacterium]
MDSPSPSSLRESLAWSNDNILKPLVNSALIEPERAIASSLKALTGKQILPECDLLEMPTADSTSARVTRTVASTVGMIVPYVIAGRAAAKPLGGSARIFAAESKTARLLSHQSTAQILGATAYDAARKPGEGETRFGNAASGTFAFGVFEAGNAIAGKTPFGLAVRAASGFIGAGGARAIHTELSKGKTHDAGDVLASGLGGAALNMVLPLGHRLASTIESRASLRMQHPELLRYADSATSANAPPASNRYLGWLSKSEPHLSRPGKGHKIAEVPMQGDGETLALGFTEFSRGQRAILADRLSKSAIKPLNNARAIDGLTKSFELETKGWHQQNLNRLSDEINGSISDITHALNKSNGKRTAQIEAMEQELSIKAGALHEGIQSRAADIENALNNWAAARGLPQVAMLVADTPGLQAQCLKGQGIIQLGPEAIMGEKLTPELLEKVVHEYSHVIQDTNMLRRMMDSRAIGKTLTNADREFIKADYKGKFGSEPSDEFLDHVRALRDGKKLTLGERLEARRNEQSISSYMTEKPLLVRPAVDGILSQMQPVLQVLEQPNGLSALRSSMQRSRGPLLDGLAERSPFKGIPLGDIPSRLAQIGKLVTNSSGEQNLQAVKQGLSEVTRDLQAMRQSSYDAYMSYGFEKQAFASGYLARLYFEAAGIAGPSSLANVTADAALKRSVSTKTS